jgi:hypothetical protein
MLKSTEDMLYALYTITDGGSSVYFISQYDLMRNYRNEVSDRIKCQYRSSTETIHRCSVQNRNAID